MRKGNMQKYTRLGYVESHRMMLQQVNLNMAKVPAPL